jgi:hypothetical protein
MTNVDLSKHGEAEQPSAGLRKYISNQFINQISPTNGKLITTPQRQYFN